MDRIYRVLKILVMPFIEISENKKIFSFVFICSVSPLSIISCSTKTLSNIIFYSCYSVSSTVSREYSKQINKQTSPDN